VTSSSFR